MKRQKEIKRITDQIVKKYKPEKIILFGSYAWGKPNEDSDVDLLIIKDSEKSSKEVAKEINQFVFPRPFAMDILAYTSAEIEEKIKKDRNLFIEDIINNGKVIYAKQ